MEALNKSDQIKVKIINLLSDFKDHTPSEIASSLSTNQNTILTNCLFLQLIGLLDIDIKKTTRINYFIRLKKENTFKSIEDVIKKIKSLK